MAVQRLEKAEGLGWVVGRANHLRQAAPAEKVIDICLEKRKRKAFQLKAGEREQLVLDFRLKARKLARSILRKWHARLDLLEVDSLVDLSLCEAVKRYDPNKGASFMTFLFYHLRGNLIRAVSTAASLNVVPVTEGEEDEGGHGRRGKSSCNISAAEVAEALCNHDSLLPDEALFRKELMALSSHACAKLDALEQEVIHRIYVKEQQLIDIAQSLGYSRCHISRVKRKALDTLCSNLAVTVKGDLGNELEELRRRLASGGKETAESRPVHRRRPRSRKALEERRRRSMVRLAVAA